MATAHHKKRFVHGMTEQQASSKFFEIWAARHPGVENPEADFNLKYPGVFPWMETWHTLRQHDRLFDVVAQAFAEKVQRLINEKVAAEQKVRDGRLELKKRLAEIDRLKQDLRAARGQEATSA